MGYADIAKKVYGRKCEICGWGKASPDVHHIDYQEHTDFEKGIRIAQKYNQTEVYDQLCKLALERGYGHYNPTTRNLPKNDRPENLSVLCPNCHREVHFFDYGMKLLDVLPPRRVISTELIKALGGL